MKLCPTCAAEYRGAEKFCSRDGTRLRAVVSEEDEASKKFEPAGEAPENRAPAVSSRSEILVREMLDERFREIEPRERPWHGTWLPGSARPDRSKTIPFLIVSPNQITAAQVVEIEGVDEGTVHGDPNLKDWFVETPDGKKHRLEISGASPFEDARQTLNFLLPNLDRFLHSRGVKNPFVHSVLVFPEKYSLAGVRDLPIGPHSRGAVILVKAADLAEAALFTTQEQKLDPVIFHEWLKGLDRDADFEDTWLALPSARRADVANAPAGAQEELEMSPSQPPYPEDPKEWVIDEAAEHPGLIELEDEELLEDEKRYRSMARDIGSSKPKRRRAVLAVTTILALVIAAMFLWLVYESNRPLTLPAYLQQSVLSPTPEADAAAAQEEPQSAPPSPESEPPKPLVERPTSSGAGDRERPAPERRPVAETPAAPRSAPKEIQTPPSSPRNIAAEPLAPSGTYETIRPTLALEHPDQSAPALDRIGSGVRLNVTGSDGDWLIVRSRARNATVYVNRKDATIVSGATGRATPGLDIETRWKEIELQIREAILKRGVPDITVSFIGDTAFLKGTVQTKQQSLAAELAAGTIPEVVHVHNGIWIRP